MARKRQHSKRRARRAGLGGTPERHADATADTLRALEVEVNVAASLLDQRKCTGVAVALREAHQLEGRLDTNYEAASGRLVGDLHKRISNVRRRTQELNEEFVGACVVKRRS